ncbi:MAG: ComEC/Rec2 family competence protein [Acidobacteriaceae bacterium]|nr:ComEC/Rec2 family competence protein [Acidobacteriaceae bacterium]
MNAPPAVAPLALQSIPLLTAAACFAFGVACAHAHWIAPARLYAGTLLLTLLAALSFRFATRVAPYCALTLWIACGMIGLQLEQQPLSQTALLPYADGLSRQVAGEIVNITALDRTRAEEEDERPWQIEAGGWEQDTHPATWRIDLRLHAIEEVTPDLSRMQPVTGGIRILLTGPAAALHCGDLVELPLRLRVPEEYRNPGAWSRRAMLLQQGIALEAHAAASSLHIAGHVQPSWHCRLQQLQQAGSNRLLQFVQSSTAQHLPHAARLTASDAAILNAMLFGERTELGTTLKQSLERTGTFHLVVVSGLHITLLTTILLWLFTRCSLPRSIAVPVTLLLITGFALLTGFGIPVQRALLMSAFYALASLWPRETSPLNVLGGTALAVLLLHPAALFEASFLMTFLVLVAASGIALPIRQRSYAPYRTALQNLQEHSLDTALPPRLAAFRVALRLLGDLLADLTVPQLRYAPALLLRALFALADALLFGAAVELCMAIPVAVFFHRLTLWSLPVNLLCVPLIALVLTSALIFFTALLLSNLCAVPFACMTALLLHTLRWVLAHLSHRTLADWRLPAPATSGTIVATLLLLAACAMLRAQRRPLALSGVLAAVLAPLPVLWPSPPSLHPGMLELTALDVGQGDALLAVTPDGHTLLVDAGGPVGGMRNSAGFDLGEEVVAPYLWSRHLARLDALVLTHAHSDHMGGMPAVLADLHPRELWLSVVPSASKSLPRLLAQASALGVRIRFFRAGDTLALGDADIRVLSPSRRYRNEQEAVNDDSLVLELSAGKASLLLEGDAEADSEAAMLQSGLLRPVSVLKVAHHGSRSSSTEAFLTAVQPHAAVISDGRQNTFGHPQPSVLERLSSQGAMVYRVDRLGATTILLDPVDGHRSTQWGELP